MSLTATVTSWLPYMPFESYDHKAGSTGQLPTHAAPAAARHPRSRTSTSLLLMSRRPSLWSALHAASHSHDPSEHAKTLGSRWEGPGLTAAQDRRRLQFRAWLSGIGRSSSRRSKIFDSGAKLAGHYGSSVGQKFQLLYRERNPPHLSSLITQTSWRRSRKGAKKVRVSSYVVAARGFLQHQLQSGSKTCRRPRSWLQRHTHWCATARCYRRLAPATCAGCLA